LASTKAAALYKPLIYDEGSFFVSHRDTEKEPGMFATLVLALPSTSSGGELVVHHQEREVKLDLAKRRSFRADICHLLCGLHARGSSGHRRLPGDARLQLIRKGKGALRPPDYQMEAARAVALLQKWGNSKTRPDDGVPNLIYLVLVTHWGRPVIGALDCSGYCITVLAGGAASIRRRGKPSTPGR
jgi:hypothetical protein